MTRDPVRPTYRRHVFDSVRVVAAVAVLGAGLLGCGASDPHMDACNEAIAEAGEARRESIGGGNPAEIKQDITGKGGLEDYMDWISTYEGYLADHGDTMRRSRAEEGTARAAVEICSGVAPPEVVAELIDKHGEAQRFVGYYTEHCEESLANDEFITDRPDGMDAEDIADVCAMSGR